mmetsp:Transcript_429/g.1221  ORF Transcript_429/g.1221 Transcript_429/m.1221 type:complete len:331 (-) Transcript_429:352-1344(-)
MSPPAQLTWRWSPPPEAPPQAASEVTPNPSPKPPPSRPPPLRPLSPKPPSPKPPPGLPAGDALRDRLAERERPCVASSSGEARRPPRKSRSAGGKLWGIGEPVLAHRTRCITATKSGNEIWPRPPVAASRIRPLSSAPAPEVRSSFPTPSADSVWAPSAMRWKSRAYFRQSLSEGTSRATPLGVGLRERLAEREEPREAKSSTGGACRKEDMHSAKSEGKLAGRGGCCGDRTQRMRCITATNSGKPAESLPLMPASPNICESWLPPSPDLPAKARIVPIGSCPCRLGSSLRKSRAYFRMSRAEGTSRSLPREGERDEDPPLDLLAEREEP